MSQQVSTAWTSAFLALIELQIAGDLALAERYCSQGEAAVQAGAALGIDFVVLARSRLLQQAGDHQAAFETLRDAWQLFDLVQVHSCKLVLAAPLAHLASQFAERDTLTAVEQELATVEPNQPTQAHQALAALVHSIAQSATAGVHKARDLFALVGRPVDARDCARYL